MGIDLYDIAIIGLGNAGSHVLLELLSQSSLDQRRIIVFDDYSADSKNKTWCYWEKDTGKWDHLVAHQWKSGLFVTKDKRIDFELDKYTYKQIKSRDFINYALTQLKKAPNCTLVQDVIEDHTEGTNEVLLTTKNSTFTSKLVFDSRVPMQFFQDTHAIKLQQHFVGWVVKTKKPSFDQEKFTMMDYRLKDPGATSFMYVLPYNQNEALVEFTYFSANVVENEVYEHYLNRYITDFLKLKDFDIVEKEKGNIPMTTYKFEKHNTPRVYKIGTAGGWVKPSTGYSFKRSENKAHILIENYKNGFPLDRHMFSKTFSLYDDIMLDVLFENNDKGHEVFEKLYDNNSITRILKFLDEDTTFMEELGIMIPMTSLPFLKGFARRLF